MDSEIQNSNSKIDTAIPRQLVLDYLLHNCYGETARAFMKDDLDAVKDVSDLRKGSSSSKENHSNNNNQKSRNGKGSQQQQHNGRTSHSQGGVMTRSASDDSLRTTGASMMETEGGEQDDENGVDHEGDSPMGESYSESRDPTLTAGTFTADKAHALQIDEQLKNLETRKAIRSLITNGDIGPAMELCNSAFPGVLSIDPHSPLTSPASIHMNFKMECQKFIEKVKAESDDLQALAKTLMSAQDILLRFKKLDPEGEEHYERHFGELGSVLAFTNPEESPNSHYLKQEARDHLADIMNSAVLGYCGMPSEPALLTIVKQATLVRETLALETSKIKRGIKVKTR
ncbi:Ran-binding protein 9 [Gryganskiella cystojenkinii]|nr:Ran-binding protein 9 [Gryganskiella cystojenkinii]